MGAGGAPRLAEVLAAVSLVTDLAMGEEQGEAARACLVAVGLGQRLGLEGDRLAAVYWTALLRNLGCTATAAEEADRLRLDETHIRPLAAVTDFTSPPGILLYLRSATAPLPARRRAGSALRLLAEGRWAAGARHASGEVAGMLAGRLGMTPEVCAALRQQDERWDGRGGPDGLSGELVALPARIAALAGQAVRLAANGGPAAAAERLRRRGGWLGPGLVAEFAVDAEELLVPPEDDPYLLVTAAEPLPWRRLPETELDRVAAALGDLADLKSPSHHGHSRGVAELVQRAAPPADRTLLRRAALLHDLGRVAVPSRGLADPKALNSHPARGERVLARCAALSETAGLVGRHHERLDGSGYPGRLTAADLSPQARLLAAADAYRTMTEPRPGRPESSPEEAARRLAAEAREGRLDPVAVHAVLEAAATPRHRSAPWPAGLDDREVEVLRLLARGVGDRAIAGQLAVPVGAVEQHVEHIRDRTGCFGRPAVALFAMEHGLL